MLTFWRAMTLHQIDRSLYDSPLYPKASEAGNEDGVREWPGIAFIITSPTALSSLGNSCLLPWRAPLSTIEPTYLGSPGLSVMSTCLWTPVMTWFRSLPQASWFLVYQKTCLGASWEGGQLFSPEFIAGLHRACLFFLACQNLNSGSDKHCQNA